VKRKNTFGRNSETRRHPGSDYMQFKLRCPFYLLFFPLSLFSPQLQLFLSLHSLPERSLHLETNMHLSDPVPESFFWQGTSTSCWLSVNSRH